MRVLRNRWFWLLVLLAALASIRWTDARGAAWYPTRRNKIRRMLRLADTRPEDVLYDLGCGDGRLVVTAARDFGARAVGVEIDPLRYLWCRARVTLGGLDGRVRIVRGDFFDVDVSDADVVVCYLLQETNDLLEDKLLRELRPGARVVSNRYTFARLTPTADDSTRRLHAYVVPPGDRAR